MGVRTRFAPTPSGYLHIGNAFSFVLTWLHARSRPGGHIRLRIDDIDAARMREEYIEDILRSIEWLGLDYDSGPTSLQDFKQNFSQHLHLEKYNTVLEELKNKGQLFACTCSRKQVQTNSVDGQYNEHCLHLNLPFDTPEASWRIITPESTNIFVSDFRTPSPKGEGAGGEANEVNLYNTMRHFQVRGKDSLASYQIVSLVEDVEHQINLVVRGSDLLQSTAAQLFIASKFDELQSFQNTRFIHHPLQLDANGEKLSKSAGSTSLMQIREVDKLPENVYRQISKWLGVEEAGSAQSLLEIYKTKIV